MSHTILTGIKPTGAPHAGNYVGAIKPLLELARASRDRVLCFVADYHALNSTRDAERLRARSDQVAATYLAFGLDPERVVFYRQSDIPEIAELAAILACVCPKGFMNRAHAYKAAVAANHQQGIGDDDAGVNMGLFMYPILMAADILCFAADRVPVGGDQLQHVEIARELALRFNRAFGEVLTMPEPYSRPIAETFTCLPGIDGRKMSKSYGNEIPLFCTPDQLRSLVFRIRTDSRRPEEPKHPDSSLLFALYAQFAPADRVAELRHAFASGIGYADVKRRVADAMNQSLAEPRARYHEFMTNPQRLDDVLARGASRARAIAAEVLARVKQAIGVSRYRPAVASSSQ